MKEEKGEILNIVAAFYRWLMPPDETASVSEKRSHEQRLSLTVLALVILFGISIAADYDKIPWVDGVAHESEVVRVIQTVDGVRTDVHDLRVQGLSDQLFDVAVKLCQASSDPDKQEYAKRFMTLGQLYFKETGTPYQGVPCPQL